MRTIVKGKNIEVPDRVRRYAERKFGRLERLLDDRTDAIVEHRDELQNFLAARHIHCRNFWHPIHTQAPYRRPDNAFPNSSRLAPHALWLPSAFTLSDEDVATVSDCISDFLSSRKPHPARSWGVA